MAAYVGVKYAAALTAGTAAIHLAVKLAGVKAGNIVLCSDLTLRPRLILSPMKMNSGLSIQSGIRGMDPAALEIALKKYGSRVKAVIVANLYGTPARLDEIVKAVPIGTALS